MNYGNVEDIMKEIINKCRTIYRKTGINNDELNEWKHSFEIILSKIKSIKTPNDLSLLIEQNIPHRAMIDEENNKMRCYQSIFKFMNKIESFGQYKISLEKKTYYIIEEEYKSIIEKIKLLEAESKKEASEKKCHEQKQEIITLKQRTEEDERTTSDLRKKVEQLEHPNSSSEEHNK